MNQASNDAAMAELRLRLEAHQRMLARWEAKVPRQLENIVCLQKNVSRTFSTESAPATPYPGLPGTMGWLRLSAGIVMTCVSYEPMTASQTVSSEAELPLCQSANTNTVSIRALC